MPQDENSIVIPGVDQNPPTMTQPPATPEPTPETPPVETTVNIEGTSYKTNENGDAINEDRTVFKTKDELETAPPEPEPTEPINTIEIDEDGVVNSFTIDKDGNAVNDKGEVVYSKDQLAELEEQQEPPKAVIDIEEISKATNIITYDDDGTPIKYENTIEGVQQRELDVYNTGGNDALKEYQNQLFGKYPILKDVINYMSINNTLEGFNNVVDYNKVEIDKTNTDQLKSIISTARASRGEDTTRINNYIEYLTSGDTDNDKLSEEANLELSYMKDVQEKNEARNAEAVEKARQQAIIDNNKYWGIAVDDKGNKQVLNVEGSIYDTITKGKIKIGDDTFTIPEKIKVVENGKPKFYNKQDFFNYLREPVSVMIDGQRQVMTRDEFKIVQENANRSTGHDILDAFKRFVNYDTSQFVKEQVNDKLVNNVKRLTIKKKPSGGTGATRKGDKLVIPGTK